MKRDSINGMESAIYDPDLDGSVEKADGPRVLAELPVDLTSFAVGAQFVVGNKLYQVTDE